MNPVEISDINQDLTEELVELIYRQETTLKKLDKIKIKGR